MIAAAENGHTEVVQMLVEQGNEVLGKAMLDVAPPK
jgi:hypothetical protein